MSAIEQFCVIDAIHASNEIGLPASPTDATPPLLPGATSLPASPTGVTLFLLPLLPQAVSAGTRVAISAKALGVFMAWSSRSGKGCDGGSLAGSARMKRFSAGARALSSFDRANVCPIRATPQATPQATPRSDGEPGPLASALPPRAPRDASNRIAFFPPLAGKQPPVVLATRPASKCPVTSSPQR